jgi:tetrahydromethanopterin S-methyltransferase subunit B
MLSSDSEPSENEMHRFDNRNSIKAAICYHAQQFELIVISLGFSLAAMMIFIRWLLLLLLSFC